MWCGLTVQVVGRYMPGCATKLCTHVNWIIHFRVATFSSTELRLNALTVFCG